MKLKKVAWSLACVLTVGCIAGCGVNYAEPEDPTKTYLRVDTYQGGFGQEFFDVAADEFQKVYPNYRNAYSSEEKSGAKIEVLQSLNNTSWSFKSNVKNSTADVHVVQGFRYTDYLGDDYILDITDIVTDTLSDGKTIESKLNPQQKEVLKYNNKYYSIPTFTGFGGLSYNIDLFTENNLFFLDSTVSPSGTSSYTGNAYTGRPLVKNATQKKAPGPDGKYGTVDDGLPSSYEEFFYLFDYMMNECQPAITPLITFRGHYTNHIFAELLSAASTVNSFNSFFTFDSKGEEVEVIDGWDGDTPITKKVVITPENGYYSTKEVSKYMALKFIRHLSTYKNEGKSYIDDRSRGTSISNTETQKVFLESYLDPSQTSIATLCEGVYWYNESADVRKSIIETYEDEAENMNLGFMTLPAKEYGTVKENEGTTQLVADTLGYYLVINANVAKDKEKLALAKDFIKFMYSDEMLQKMTVASNIPFALKYELSPAQYNKMDHLAQSFWDVNKAAIDNNSYITGMSLSPIYLNNLNKFCFETTGDFYKSKVGGKETVDALTHFYSTMLLNSTTSAKDFFTGLTISNQEWASKYNIYNAG